MSKQKCERLAQKYLATLDEVGDSIYADAPFRKLWKSNGEHFILAIGTTGQRTEAWKELALDMQLGLIDCTGLCHECGEKYRKELN